MGKEKITHVEKQEQLKEREKKRVDKVQVKMSEGKCISNIIECEKKSLRVLGELKRGREGEKRGREP